jgi:predicted nucleotidyltransferase
MRPPKTPDLIVPPGTQVVSLVELRRADGSLLCLRGAVGVITSAPVDHTHAYRVRLPDGNEISLHRPQFAIRKQAQAGALIQPETVLEEYDLKEYVIYRCIVGSHAYNLSHDQSDIDRRGIYLPPAERHWALYGVPEQLEDHTTQECYWEIRKFLILALKANPNILECLYTPLVEYATPLAEELRAMRACFLSKLIYQTYNGYVLSQFKKLEADLRGKGAVNWKHAMHLIRLLLSGIHALQAGKILVDACEYRDTLLAIRYEEVNWDEVNAWRLELHRQFDTAYQHTQLPDYPDYEKVNAFLIRARRSVI